MRIYLTLVALLAVTQAGTARAQRPADIIDVEELIPGIALEIRYFTDDNFIGRPIPGYDAPKCLLTRRAVEALQAAQQTLREFGLGLKLYDCYRPQRAVDYFVAWAEDLDDRAMKTAYYPSVDKRDLFQAGYIAARSGHSRASTVDLTIVQAEVSAAPSRDGLRAGSCEDASRGPAPDGSIDMGTSYDCFSTRSHTLSTDIAPQQRANRMLLMQLLESHGFRNLPEEWWHFTLVDEPYPDSYFDFPIE